jgi:hypothetical protein
MLGDDEDVFDSVTWESPSSPAYDTPRDGPSGPGFRQSTSDSDNPNDPKWEGYLITTVSDPVKELAETKDAYVSYLVAAQVCSSIASCILCAELAFRPTSGYSQRPILPLAGGSRTLCF